MDKEPLSYETVAPLWGKGLKLKEICNELHRSVGDVMKASLETIRHFYLDENLTIKKLSDTLGINESTLKTFLRNNQLGKKDNGVMRSTEGYNNRKKNIRTVKETKTEKCETEPCSICNKNINFSFGSNRREWVYKTSSKGYTKYQCSYSCMRQAQKLIKPDKRKKRREDVVS